jgi:hypothetical protein
MMSMLCNCCVRELLILTRTWFAFGLPSKTGCDSLPWFVNIEGIENTLFVTENALMFMVTAKMKEASIPKRSVVNQFYVYVVT